MSISGKNEETETQVVKPKKKIFSISNIFLAFAIILFVFVIGTIITAEEGEELSFFGYRPAIILTGSMEPEIMQYGIVLLKDCEYEDVQVGDVVAYSTMDAETDEEIHIVHEVIDITEEGLVTKGTNNNTPDPYPVTKDMVYAEVVWHTNILNTLYYNPSLIIFSGIFVIAAVVFFVVLRKLLKERKAEKLKMDSESNDEIKIDG